VRTDFYNLKVHVNDTLEHQTLFVPICLLGKFKGETGMRHHIIAIAGKTKTRIDNAHGLEEFNFFVNKRVEKEVGCTWTRITSE